MYDLSVIVPTHNRKELLPGLVESLASQDYPASRWELVIVDDGSSDGTSQFLASYAGARPAQMRVISQPQSGVATARNNASWAAAGRALLYLDDDMIASPSLVRAHAEVHLEDARAVVIGHVSLPSSDREPWVAWEDDQMLRHFDALKSGRRIPGPRDFYSGNCSVSASLFKEVNGYDTTLKRAEDVEIGYRLKAADARFYYRAGADSLHLGRHAFEGWLRNARLYGQCDVVLAWEKGHIELQCEIFRWYHLRQPLNRALVRLCSTLPPLESLVVRILDTAGRAAHRAGKRRLSSAAYSAIYNVAYWLSISREIGPAEFWRGVRRASTRPLSPPSTDQEPAVERAAQG